MKMSCSSSSPCKSPLEDGLGAAAPNVDGDSGFVREDVQDEIFSESEIESTLMEVVDSE